MKKLIASIGLLLLPAVLLAQGDGASRNIRIDSVTVTGRRPLQSIGAQKTVIDTIALGANVINSLADVLAHNTSIFIKSYGRGTLASASFRGTAPSHTQVTWNGMRMNSPMLGMVDLSLIPSYFIDNASLYHGASSVGLTGGGLGGAVALGTELSQEEGLGVRYVLGVGSYSTTDEFLHLTCGTPRFQLSTRVYLANSDNDFKYTNYHKKLYIKDEQGNITGRYHPRERNRNGDFRDFHILQEACYNTLSGHRFGFSAWYTDSHRGLPALTVDRRGQNQTKEYQNERTFRGVLKWDKVFADLRLDASAGVIYTDFNYIYKGDNGEEQLQTMTDSRNYTTTVYADLRAQYYRGDKWSFSANVSLYQNDVSSHNDVVKNTSSADVVVGYKKARPELSAHVSVKYKPTRRLGLAVSLREEWCGKHSPRFIPSAFAEYALTRCGELLLKGSAARNYRFPTLNDLYFLPGGNAGLKPEYGFTYDAGLEYGLSLPAVKLSAEATWFDSLIKDWILWIMERPYPRPLNVKEVHSYGLEFKANALWTINPDWKLSIHGNYALTNSVNRGKPFSENDNSVGKQLPYIPKYSAAITGRLGWRKWEFTYKWHHYSERFTTSSNDDLTSGRLPSFYMSDISLQKQFQPRWGRVTMRGAVNNLFDEQYESVLSRPMPGRNFGIYLEITPCIRR